jgi:prephenate dehydrogenase
MTVQITILGLGQTGSSIGLALGEAKDQVTRVGSDKEPEVSKQAQKLGAVDKVVFTLPDAVADADVVVLALPVDEVRFTLETIAPHLKPGAVVLDTSPVTVQSTQWAKETISAEDRYFLTFTPAVNARYLSEPDKGPASAHADLYKDSVVMITGPAGVDESAVSLAENLARLLGSTPVFSEPYEVDGLLSANHLLPGLMAVALVNITAGKPGWNDGRKIASSRYARVAELAEYVDGGKKPALEVLHNRENAVRALESLMIELAEMRDALSAGDEEKIHAKLETAREAHRLWLRQRTTGKWEESGSKTPGLPRFGESIGRLFGIRPKRDKEKDGGK